MLKSVRLIRCKWHFPYLLSRNFRSIVLRTMHTQGYFLPKVLIIHNYFCVTFTFLLHYITSTFIYQFQFLECTFNPILLPWQHYFLHDIWNSKLIVLRLFMLFNRHILFQKKSIELCAVYANSFLLIKWLLRALSSKECLMFDKWWSFYCGQERTDIESWNS